MIAVPSQDRRIGYQTSSGMPMSRIRENGIGPISSSGILENHLGTDPPGVGRMYSATPARMDDVAKVMTSGGSPI